MTKPHDLHETYKCIVARRDNHPWHVVQKLKGEGSLAFHNAKVEFATSSLCRGSIYEIPANSVRFSDWDGKTPIEFDLHPKYEWSDRKVTFALATRSYSLVF